MRDLRSEEIKTKTCSSNKNKNEEEEKENLYFSKWTCLYYILFLYTKHTLSSAKSLVRGESQPVSEAGKMRRLFGPTDISRSGEK